MVRVLLGVDEVATSCQTRKFAVWRAVCLCFLLAAVNGLNASEPETAKEDNSKSQASLDELLVDTPLLNDLLVDYEIPLIGGGWGGEIFIDVPLNGEPEGAQITLRRAKAWYARNFGNDWRLKMTADYTDGGGLELSNTYFTYSGWDKTLLTLGINDPAFSLESVSQSAALTFMERGLVVNALAERRSGGVTFLRRNPKSILNASLILFNVSRDDLQEDGQGLVFHYVHSPIRIGRTRSVHVGGSLSYRWNTSEENTRFRSRPEVATINDYFVDTGEIAGAEKNGRIGLEASHVAGRFSWQSEIIAARIQRVDMANVYFWGAYAYASWFLTDDSRNYNFGSGSFEKIHVNKPVREGGWGAFELGFRASYLDLSDGDVIGGREKNLSLGLNWYLNRHLRLMANVVKVMEVDRPGSEFDGQDPLSFSLRFQWVIH